MQLLFNQESDFRQQRDFGQKISATFEFIRVHWRSLGLALVYIVLPAALLAGIVAGVVQSEALGSLGVTSGSDRAGILARLAAMGSYSRSPFYWLNLVSSGIFVALLSLTVNAYMLLCLHSSPGAPPPTVSAVWAVAKPRLIKGVLSYYVLLIAVVVGMFFLLIPGIYLSVAFALFFTVKTMENTSFGATASRCLQLTRGKWWSTFGLILIMLLIPFVVATVFDSLVGGLAVVLGGGLGALRSGAFASQLGMLAVVSSTLGSLLNLLIYPPVIIAIAFQYFNLVEHKDGVGLHNLINQLGQAPVGVANNTYRPDDEGEY